MIRFAAICLLAAGMLLAWWIPAPIRHAEADQAGFSARVPERIGMWERQSVGKQEDLPEALDINEVYQALYRHPDGRSLALTLEFTSDNRRQFELHYPDVCHAIRGDTVSTLPLRQVILPGGHSVLAAQMDWRQAEGGYQALATYWYVTPAGVTTNTLMLKFKQALAGLIARPEAAVMVRVDRFYDANPNAPDREQLSQDSEELLRSLYLALDAESRHLLFETVSI